MNIQYSRCIVNDHFLAEAIPMKAVQKSLSRHPSTPTRMTDDTPYCVCSTSSHQTKLQIQQESPKFFLCPESTSSITGASDGTAFWSHIWIAAGVSTLANYPARSLSHVAILSRCARARRNLCYVTSSALFQQRARPNYLKHPLTAPLHIPGAPMTNCERKLECALSLWGERQSARAALHILMPSANA